MYTNLQVVVTGFYMPICYKHHVTILRNIDVPGAFSVVRVAVGIVWRVDVLIFECGSRVKSALFC